MVQEDDDAKQRRIEKLKARFAAQDDRAIDETIADLMKSRSGRKFLWWLLGLGQLGRNPFAGNALTTSFNCGELNVSQRMLDRILNVNAVGYAQLMQEEVDERRTRTDLFNGRNENGGTDGADGADDSAY